MSEADSASVPVIVGVVLLREDDAALLQLRDDKPDIQDPGIWVFPGGHIEPGETAEEGALREFTEETCYACAGLNRLVLFNGMELGYTWRFDLIFYWAAFDGRQEIHCREGQALEFVRRERAPELPARPYLTQVWDLAIAARRQMEKDGGPSGARSAR